MTADVRTRVVPGFTATDPTGQAIARCWLDVSNAGGAVGFPFIPVSQAEVHAATERLASEVSSGSVVLFLAEDGGELVGWVSLRLNRSNVAKHWATVERLQRRPERQGLAIGRKLMHAVRDQACLMGLEHLQLVLRSGMGLEDFYKALGWQEIGRHPNALRLVDGDRDEVSMMLRLSDS